MAALKPCRRMRCAGELRYFRNDGEPLLIWSQLLLNLAFALYLVTTSIKHTEEPSR